MVPKGLLGDWVNFQKWCQTQGSQQYCFRATVFPDHQMTVPSIMVEYSMLTYM